MKDIKREFIRDTALEIMALPENKLNYVLGVMNGILIGIDLKEENKNDISSDLPSPANH